jgi:hypothetical protein
MRVPSFLSFLLALVGCAPKFVDTTTPGGVPNLVQYAPKMWRMGQPPNEAAWKELATHIAPNGEKVVVVKLNDEVEGSDDPAEKLLGWTVVRIPIPPEDDKPWTIVLKPSVEDVHRAVQAILDAHANGFVVAWHCSHGRDRTGLVSALVGQKMFSWTRPQMEADMTNHGFRWVDVDLTAYFFEEVPGAKKSL